MEMLQRLTRRQVDALRIVSEIPTGEHGVHLRDVASRLKVAPPSALTHLTALERLGLVVRYRGKTRLTSKGRDALLEYARHHRVVEYMFAKVGFPAERICDAAREVDLSLHHTTVERLCLAAGHPAVCPHGDPIVHTHRGRGGR